MHKVTSPVGYEYDFLPTWKNTLHSNFSVRENIGHIMDMMRVADTLGYPYMLWNDRVYSFITEDTCQGQTVFPEDTGWTVNNLYDPPDHY